MFSYLFIYAVQLYLSCGLLVYFYCSLISILYCAYTFIFPWTLDAIVLSSHAPLLFQISH